MRTWPPLVAGRLRPGLLHLATCIGTLALLVSFVTLAHSVGDSYEEGVVLLGLWAARMFPPVLAAVSVYRIVIEPDVLPGLRAWADREGIPLSPGVESALKGLRPKGGLSSEYAQIPLTPGSAPPSAGLRPAAYTSESVRDEGREKGDEQEGRHDN